MNASKKKRYERPVLQPVQAGITSKFGPLRAFAPQTHIDGVAVKELIAAYGSPLFVVSERTIHHTYQQARTAFRTRYPKVQFAWSYKTNYLDAVCRIFHQQGAWAEVVSGFEYDKARANGIPGKYILFNGPDKSEADLRKAIAHDSPIHIDHFDELYTLIGLSEEMGRRPRVAIRVNMDTGVYPMWDRFGFNYENGQAWEAVQKIFLSGKLELMGLHTHIGTYMLSSDAYATATAKLSQLALAIRKEYDHAIQYLDLGGGFASRNMLKGSYYAGANVVPSFDDYAEAITTSLLRAGFPRQELPTLILETGRALIDDAGWLLGTVLANKRLSDGRRATILDFGVNLLFTSFWYDHLISPAQECSQYGEDTVLYGPLCMNIDVVREQVKLPLLQKGDHVVVHRVGAYNMTQWMQFITLRPAVVLLDLDGQAHLIRQSETLEYIQSVERLPPHLAKTQPPQSE